MKEISLKEQKKILVEILNYIDNIARKNHIKYSLIGGSLIGAVRHSGIIPWDDDIDIGLLPSEYDRLIQVIKKDNNGRYKLLDVESEPSYYYPFAKVIDTRTTGYEIDCKEINNYGVYVDIFKYNYISDNETEIKDYYDKRAKMQNSLFKSFINDSNNIPKKIYHKIMSKRNSVNIAKKYIEFSEQYNDKEMNNVMINWTPYGYKKETHSKKSFEEYIDVKFENIDVMILKDYDKVLKTTFGDYMTPPPKEKQITHHSMKMYWKD